MIDLKYYNIICRYYGIIINNKSQNISGRLVYNLFNKYKNLLGFDGGFSEYPYIENNNLCLVFPRQKMEMLYRPNSSLRRPILFWCKRLYARLKNHSQTHVVFHVSRQMVTPIPKPRWPIQCFAFRNCCPCQYTGFGTRVQYQIRFP